jgi:two-component system CheB/CheR fusion protein
MNTTNDSANGSRRVLVIDDRRDGVLAVQKLLQAAGHDVTVADNGRTGIELARILIPDVILCDIGLPGDTSGYDVARAIRADPACREIYTVAISGYGEPEHVRRAQAAGFDNHAVKPVSKIILERLVTQMPHFGDPGFTNP